VDRKALKILSDTYWSSKGWKPESEQVTPDEDFLHARRAGVMFDPVRLSHDEIIRRALRAVDEIDPADVADAFLSSLSTRRLELRSALGSYAVLRHLPAHEHHDRRKECPVCGECDRPREDVDLNVLNFERFKWGGVRHEQPSYAGFDLERFLEAERPDPKDSDRAIFRDILRAVESAPPETTAPRLQARLGGIFPSNKAEREILINILGYSGILRTPGHPGFRDRFIPIRDRESPPHRFVDMGYPACWWRKRDGIDLDAVRDYFPEMNL
jgi:hypothetical protein